MSDTAPSFNDLLGLPYRWGAHPSTGATDCFHLVATGLARYTGFDWTPRFQWVYKACQEPGPPSLVYRLLLRHGKPCLPTPGAVGYVRTGGVGALSLVTDHGLLLIGPHRRVMHLPAQHAPETNGFYRISNV